MFWQPAAKITLKFTFRSFRESSSGVLLCTDVAARGLDLPQVKHISQLNETLGCHDTQTSNIKHDTRHNDTRC